MADIYSSSAQLSIDKHNTPGENMQKKKDLKSERRLLTDRLRLRGPLTDNLSQISAQKMSWKQLREAVSSMDGRELKGLVSNIAKTEAESRGGSFTEKIKDALAEELIRATMRENKGRIEELLGAGVDINRGNSDGITALMSAALDCQNNMIVFLLERGADPDIGDRTGVTALGWAEAVGHGIVYNHILSEIKKKTNPVQDNITPRTGLQRATPEPHDELLVESINNIKEVAQRAWDGHSDEELLDFAKDVVIAGGIESRREFQMLCPEIHGALARRELLERIEFRDDERAAQEKK